MNGSFENKYMATEICFVHRTTQNLGNRRPWYRRSKRVPYVDRLHM